MSNLSAAVRSAPREVRAAGVIVGVQGIAGLAFAVALVVRGLTVGTTPGQSPYPMAGYFALLGIGVVVSGGALAIGRRWGRTPAIVLQLLLLGTAWYAVEGSNAWIVGVSVAVLCAAVLVLLFVARSRAWWMDDERAARGR